MLQIQVIGQLEFVHICRHPLYEDVNWNALGRTTPWEDTVILYMRMWIEILVLYPVTVRKSVILYMRMWIEIYAQKDGNIGTTPVILYMRMWIEIAH